jgi:hypothetical protein
MNDIRFGPELVVFNYGLRREYSIRLKGRGGEGGRLGVCVPVFFGHGLALYISAHIKNGRKTNALRHAR